MSFAIGQRVVCITDLAPSVMVGEQGVIRGVHFNSPDFFVIDWDGPPSAYRHDCCGVLPDKTGYWLMERDFRVIYADPLHESIQAYIQKELAL